MASWIVTADARRAQLYRCDLRPAENGGPERPHLELVEDLTSPWESMHEHGRPSVLGRGPSPSAAQHMASPGHEREEEERRFARDVAEWIARSAADLRAQQLTVFAPARFLGHLRRESPGYFALREAELTGLRPQELAGHPAVLACIGRHAT